MSLPRLIITGSSGFVGRHFLEAIKDRYLVYGIARRSQARCGAPVHPNIRWFQADIGDRELLANVFRSIRNEGGADVVIHLAAHYDFSGEKHPEYWRTNVDGLRNVLEECRDLKVQRFVFSSSLAACSFPRPGHVLTESSPPDGDHIYARTKAMGERMLGEYQHHFPSHIVRFAALFSDWCEYPPLYKFLDTWLSSRWNRRMLGGRGYSAIPYLHVRDAVAFLQSLLAHLDRLEPNEVLNASGDGAVSHRDLFLTATHYHFGELEPPILVPRPLVLPGIRLRCLLGRLLGDMPFERPWMAKYVDRSLTVNAARTRQRLSWSPRPRLEILRRIPFLIENLEVDPLEWHRRNRAAMKQARIRPNLKIHALLGKHDQEISDAFTEALTHESARVRFPSYQRIEDGEHEWHHRLILRQLMSAVRTRERSVFMSYCRDLAERRHNQGFKVEELVGALRELETICIRTLRRDPEAHDVLPYLHEHLSITIHFACDQVEETFELMEARRETQPGYSPRA